MKCSICGKVINNSEPEILFVGEHFDDKVICDACAKKFEFLYNGTDKARIQAICKFFSDCSKRCADMEVREYLVEMLRSGGYKDKEPDDEPTNTETESGWISLLRLIAWLEIVAGCIGSIVIGVGLGEALWEPAIGVGVAIVGIIMSFILSAVVMVFLDVASDIRTIRQRMK